MSWPSCAWIQVWVVCDELGMRYFLTYSCEVNRTQPSTKHRISYFLRQKENKPLWTSKSNPVREIVHCSRPNEKLYLLCCFQYGLSFPFRKSLNGHQKDKTPKPLPTDNQIQKITGRDRSRKVWAIKQSWCCDLSQKSKSYGLSSHHLWLDSAAA